MDHHHHDEDVRDDNQHGLHRARTATDHQNAGPATGSRRGNKEQRAYPLDSWQQRLDLIDDDYRPVLGIHTGGGSDPHAIAARMGRRIQAAPIYLQKNGQSPRPACEKMLRAGTVPRLELCLPHIFTSGGQGMPGRATFWRRGAEGMYDDGLKWLLQEIGSLDHAIFLSAGHESDLRTEDGASPKSESPPETDYCGDWGDFPDAWDHFAELARRYAPKARLFLNWSGGYEGAPKRWSQMLPSKGTFDFFGWDPYSQYGKGGSTVWDSFETRMKMFGRWDWYKKNIPDIPILIGETGVCEGPGGSKDAGQWLLDMVDFMVQNRWRGVGTGGGIAQIHYFSHHYEGYPRCLDEPHDGVHGQKWRVLPKIGADPRLAWAGSPPPV